MSYFLIDSKISSALTGPSTWLLIQLMASHRMNVNDGKLWALAKKLTPVNGWRIASKISCRVALQLSLASVIKLDVLKKYIYYININTLFCSYVSSLSSLVITSTLESHGCKLRPAASAAGEILPGPFSTFDPDLQHITQYGHITHINQIIFKNFRRQAHENQPLLILVSTCKTHRK